MNLKSLKSMQFRDAEVILKVIYQTAIFIKCCEWVLKPPFSTLASATTSHFNYLAIQDSNDLMIKGYYINNDRTCA